jgi:hypothetical protein
MFWSVTGAIGGSSYSTDISPTVRVGDRDIVATAWYGTYGAGIGLNAIILDAIDLDSQNPLDDDFVTVNPDPLHPPDNASAEANDGGLNTENWQRKIQSCTIVANSSISSRDFVRWLIPEALVHPPPPAPSLISIDANSTLTLNVKPHAEAFALALYKRPPEPIPDPGCEKLYQAIQTLIGDKLQAQRDKDSGDFTAQTRIDNLQRQIDRYMEEFRLSHCVWPPSGPHDVRPL